jgi:hypothetical protein
MSGSARFVGPRLVEDDEDQARRGRLDLSLAAVVVVALSRLIEPPGVWFVAIFLLGAMLVGAVRVLGGAAPDLERMRAVPVASLILPAVAAVAFVGVIRLVPFGLWLAPALLLTFLVVHRCLALEARLLATPAPLDADQRTTMLVTILVVAFLGFVGVAATAPNGLGALTPDATSAPLDGAALLQLVVGDAVIAFLLGYRAAALRLTSTRDLLLSALTYLAAIAIGAAALRAMAIPRLLGPALLTLAFYLWDSVHATPPVRRRDVRWWWQVGLLGVLGVVVIAWNLLLRGP